MDPKDRCNLYREGRGYETFQARVMEEVDEGASRGSQDPSGSSSLRLWEAEMKAGSEGTSASISCFSPGSWMRKDPRNVRRFTPGHTVRQHLGSLHLQLHPRVLRVWEWGGVSRARVRI